jgi:hypothetical protein
MRHDGQNTLAFPKLPDESSPSRKNKFLSENRNAWFTPATSPGHEGRYGQSSRNVGRDAMDADVREMMRAEADGQVAWS